MAREGTMPDASESESVFTKLQRIAEAARRNPAGAFTSLNHLLGPELLRAAFKRVRKDGAPGVDGRTWAEYEADFESRLPVLLDLAKSGCYRAPPVRRVHIPKGTGPETRPIGIPTIEDKLLQRAVVMILEAIYEQDFHPGSFGFRPGRSAHQALHEVREATRRVGGGWVLEVDIRKYFDTVDHAWLRTFLHRRVRDGVILRLIGKWLNAGVWEGGSVSYPDQGTPQGGVISPLLANVYLHEVLDTWWESEVRPRLRGRSTLVRYADDFVLVFEYEADARRVQAVLAKRFEKHGLQIHPEKTRLVRFERPREGCAPPGQFDLLGFTHRWERSRRGYWVVKRRTAKSRLRRGLQRIALWCRFHRHEPIGVQQRALALRLRGHDAYYGITGNFEALRAFRWQVLRIWRKWLSRRSQRGYLSWERFGALMKRFPLPRARVVHSIYRAAAKA
jgi:group II intron reverse transcriptase/maturase